MSRPRLKKDYDPEIVRSNASSVKDSLDLNATKIARATGVTRQTVSSIMSGKMEASPRWVEAFCVAYHIDREWLEKGNGEPVFTGIVTTADTKDASEAGKRLVEMRMSLGIPRKEIYEMLGITQTMYSRIENGHVGLTVENAKKIEDAYGIGAEWILYGDEGKKRYPIGNKILDYLWNHEEERKRLWEMVEK